MFHRRNLWQTLMDASLPASSMRPREMGHCKGDRGRLWRDPFRDLPCSKLRARPSSARPGPASRSDRRRWLHALVKVARHDAKRGDRSDCRAPDDLTRLLRSVGNHDERTRCRMGEWTTLSTGARRIIGQGTGSGASRGTSKCPIRGSARPAPGAGFFFLAVSASSHCCRSCRGTDTDLRGSSGRVRQKQWRTLEGPPDLAPVFSIVNSRSF